MELADGVVVITGAASGIGAACARRLAREQPRAVVCADVDVRGAEEVADAINATAARPIARAIECDVGREDSVAAVIEGVARSVGVIDVYIANAGISALTDPFTENLAWERAWRVNTMAHVWAARHLLPAWIERGAGCFVAVASMAGILSAQGQAAYAVTKHATVGFAEWMGITYRGAGVVVSCVCPGGVNTPMLTGFVAEGGPDSALAAGGDLLEPAEVAELVVAGIRDERTLVLTHPGMATYMQRKVADHDRWIAGMARQWGTGTRG